VAERTDLPVVSFADAAAWEAWLEAEHLRSPGVWLAIGRKGSELPSVTYPEAVEVALCFGWIDGQKGAGDALAWRQRFTPRGPRSRWSKINVAAATRLGEAGRLRAAGHREVERAQADGRWAAAYDAPRTATPHPDLAAALDANPAAAAAFAALGSRERYAMLYRVGEAKRAETRARRVATYVGMLERGETLSLWPSR